MPPPSELSVETITSELQERVRERVRQDVLRHGASESLNDAEVFTAVDALLRRAVSRSHPSSLIMPEALGDPSTWRLDTALRYSSHRGGTSASVIVFVKQRVLMPVFRWLFEYSRDNFERQRRVNEILFACVQELAIENARLRQDLERRASR